MAILNSVFSFLGSVPAQIAPSIVAPGKMWHLLILNVFSFVADYGWRIVVFTVLLKLILSPLDFYQRYKMNKNQKITERLKPTMEKLQKQYAGDKQAFSQKQMELNRKEGYSYFSSCLPMIVTIVIFITLWISMQTIAEYMTFKEYATMYDEYSYVQMQIEGKERPDKAEEEKEEDYDYYARNEQYKIKLNEIVAPYKAEKEKYEAQIKPFDDKIKEIDKQLADKELSKEEKNKLKAEKKALEDERKPIAADLKAATTAFDDANNISMRIGQDVIYQMYYYGIDDGFADKLKENADYAKILPDDFKVTRNGKKTDKVQASFLWIQNIWAPDVPWGDKAILDYDSFKTGIDDYYYADTNGIKDGSTLSAMRSKVAYNEVMGKLLSDKTHSRTNGYLILPILVVTLSLGSQLLSSMQQKRAGQVNNKGGVATSMKVMMVIMPIMMAVFALQYASIFALYMVVNSATTLFFNLTFTGIIKLIDYRRRNRQYGITTGSVRTIKSGAGSPIIHYVKGANPNAGAKEVAPVPVADNIKGGIKGEDVRGKDKKNKKQAQARPALRGGRPDPNDLMNVDMSSKNSKKK